MGGFREFFFCEGEVREGFWGFREVCLFFFLGKGRGGRGGSGFFFWGEGGFIGGRGFLEGGSGSFFF